MKGKTKPPWITWRRLSQVLFLLLFFILFIKTDYNGTDEIPYAVNILFRIDPLVAAAAMLAAKAVIAILLPALIVVALTLLLGRAFCGWLCPMGALIDFCRRWIRPRANQPRPGLRRIKYVLLALVLTGAFFGLPVVGYFDPFSILVRGFATSVYPAANGAVTEFFTVTYKSAPAWVNAVTEPLYALLKATILPFKQKLFTLSLLSLAMLLAVFALEKLERRFFCRNLCPLGALLALNSWFSLMRGRAADTRCGDCRLCERICRMNAIDGEKRISPEACILCMECVDRCPQEKIAFGFDRPAPKPAFAGMPRRTFVAALVSGAVLPAFLKTRTIAAVPPPELVRPPGALPEPEFLGRCVRCAECMQVCIGNALHPAFLEAGMEGVFTPRLMARVGYCEYNCTLCGQVCPTGAIRPLPLAEKQKTVIGLAIIDKNTCLPFAKGVPCIVCEEHCPTPDKAIKFRMATVLNERGESVRVKQPYVIDRLCIGCGICETRCPVAGRSAIVVTSAGESRHPEIGGGY